MPERLGSIPKTAKQGANAPLNRLNSIFNQGFDNITRTLTALDNADQELARKEFTLQVQGQMDRASAGFGKFLLEQEDSIVNRGDGLSDDVNFDILPEQVLEQGRNKLNEFAETIKDDESRNAFIRAGNNKLLAAHGQALGLRTAHFVNESKRGIFELENLSIEVASKFSGISPENFNSIVATDLQRWQRLADRGGIDETTVLANHEKFKARLGELRFSMDVDLAANSQDGEDLKTVLKDLREGKYLGIKPENFVQKKDEALRKFSAIEKSQRTAENNQLKKAEKELKQEQDANSLNFTIQAKNGDLDHAALDLVAKQGGMTDTQLRAVTNFNNKLSDRGRKSEPGAVSEYNTLIIAQDGQGVTITNILSDDRLNPDDKVTLMQKLQKVEANPSITNTINYKRSTGLLNRSFDIPEGLLGKIGLDELESRQARQAAAFDEFETRVIDNGEDPLSVSREIVDRDFETFDNPTSPFAKLRVKQGLSKIPRDMHVFRNGNPDGRAMHKKIKEGLVSGEILESELPDIEQGLEVVETIVGTLEEREDEANEAAEAKADEAKQNEEDSIPSQVKKAITDFFSSDESPLKKEVKTKEKKKAADVTAEDVAVMSEKEFEDFLNDTDEEQHSDDVKTVIKARLKEKKE